MSTPGTIPVAGLRVESRQVGTRSREPLSAELLQKMHAYWRAANYLSVGQEEGTTTTPFDMVVLNNLDRYQLMLDAIQRIPRLGGQVVDATARYWATMERHKLYIAEHGDDLPEVRDWRWSI